MSDEDKVEDQKQEREYSDLEKTAMDIGWDPNGKKDAKSFIIDGQKMRNEKITDLYELHADMKELMKQQKEHAYEQARKDLLAQRDEAIQRGDLDEVRKLDRDEGELKVRQAIQNEANAFMKRNTWYSGLSKEERAMQKACAEIDVALAKKMLPPNEHFAALEKAVQEEFPDYFNLSSVERKKPASVESGSGRAVTKSKKEYSYDDLNDAQKKSCDRYVNMKLMTREQYIAEIVSTGKLK